MPRTLKCTCECGCEIETDHRLRTQTGVKPCCRLCLDGSHETRNPMKPKLDAPITMHELRSLLTPA